ncbi:hypothetical protein DID78_05855 [Candidatus Marinamargulisbacteria bacterium SCGC AG-343-D04]|nr:hypothetical protein DID78_05855 [Candidatus Marinamargulisbacteria bacterium SCGC AG-343-D04]
MNQKKSIYTKLAILFAIILSFLSFNTIGSFLWSLEQSSIDFRFSLSNRELQNDDIVIIDIDTSSINRLSYWPWPRHYWAQAISQLNKYEAKLIGVDVLFDSNSLNPENDIAFSKALQETSNVVLSSRKHTETKANYEIETWSTPIPILSQYADVGFVNFPYDSDGYIRKAFSILDYQKDDISYSFDLLILQKYLQKPLSDILPNLNNRMLFLNKPFQLDQDYSYYVNFKLASSFTHIPFYLLIEDRLQDPSILKDKIVLFGATDPSLNDFFFTPKGYISGVELHAYSILTLLKESPLTYINPVLNSILALYLVFMIISTTRRSPALRGFFYTLFMLLLYSSVSIILFYYFNMIVMLVPFLILCLCAYVITIFLRFIKEETEKHRIHSIFKQYVSPEVVSTLIKNPESLELGGQKREVTIFFSDIRSFTSLSEKYPPEDIIIQLNEYLDAMTRCIFKWQGTLDKYVGDEIMAVWGSPIQQSDQALLSVFCAWEQLDILKDLQHKWKNEKKPLFDLGIGINTGQVIVGNIGSSTHKDFTVIGDPVNYAARLESCTRDFSSKDHICRFIISHTTYNKVKKYVEVKPLGKVSVKGKKESFPIYEVINVSIPKTYLST